MFNLDAFVQYFLNFSMLCDPSQKVSNYVFDVTFFKACLHGKAIFLQMTGSRIKVAGRFKPCVHMGCFDLEAFVELNQRSRKVRLLVSNQLIFSLSCLIKLHFFVCSGNAQFA
jgi:hypothetical protein